MLVIALIMLLVLTMLGVSTVQSTVVSERMAGHFRNKQNSFDAAEAALRDGEDAAEAFPIYAPTDGTGGLYQPTAGAEAVWDASATAWQTRGGTALGGVAAQPQYVVEYLGGVPRDDNCLLDADASSNTDCWRYAYRVSAQGWGNNLNASTVTQSTTLTRK
ncbi:MAG: PilX N-terminal domain-containing pilus assembly protein [Oceanibaculum nanhaiense]|uniref:pilus assembly PilX family protein n=1 Tax=Oceanibaculum nanhaiense TaxID=1909734 RepID=UPI0032F05F9B